MNFKFDPRTSEDNKKMHAVDFVEVQALWDDPDLLEIPARTENDPRFLVIGKIGGKHWSGIITHREEKVRIISVRRARNEEIELYES